MKGSSVFSWDALTLFKKAFSEWNKDNASLMAAAMAYYAAFSLVPLTIILIDVFGFLLTPTGHPGVLERGISGFLGVEVAQSIAGIIANARNPSPTIFTTSVAVLFLFIGATGLFLQTKRGLNIVWGVKPKSGAIINTLKSYILSFIQLILAGLIILVSAILTAVITSTGRTFRSVLPFNFTLLHALNFFILFIAAGILFASTYKTLSGVHLLWTDVLYGSFFTTLLFAAGNFLIGLYLGIADIGSVYGAASSLFVILFWVYYSAQIFFFGAELIKVYARRCGSQKCA